MDRREPALTDRGDSARHPTSETASLVPPGGSVAPLTPGSRLGRYEIVAPLGAGGMGEVWRARDARLGREVAIKVLPWQLTADRQALARFEREARAVAALTHPNILAIHDFERDGDTVYAVTELLEGETLRQRLRSGPVPLRKAREWGAQVAHALAVVHDHGIVHRDVKPENLFLTKSGAVKLLDFGVARQLQNVGGGPGGEEAKTAVGTVVGTIGYIAPEQVKGGEADGRTDIFALGCVLYEMAIGERAFAGGSMVETIAAIADEDPPRLRELVERGSPEYARVVRRCLEKAPEQRFQSAHDLAFALEGTDPHAVTSAFVHPPVEAPSVWRRWPLRAALAAAAAGLLLAAGVFVGRRLAASAATAVGRPTSFAQLTDTPGLETAPTLAPDGKSVVFVGWQGGRQKLYLLRVGGRNATPLEPESTSDDWQPAFSPDGERIAFRSERDGGGIFVMGATGESVKRLTDFGYHPAWSPDGREIVVSLATFFYPTDRAGISPGLTAVDVDTGARREVVRTDALQPAWSPHGHRVAFWGGGRRDIVTVAADGSQSAGPGVAVTDDAATDWSPTWSPDGRWLWYSSNRGGAMNLWRVPIDEETGRARGAAEPVTVPSLWSGEISFSRDGTRLAYSSTLWRSTLYRIAFDPRREETAGVPQAILESAQPIRDHDLSPDGSQIALMQMTSQEDVALAGIDGSRYRRLTDDVTRDRGPTWSPDGREIAFYRDRGGGVYQIWGIRPDGSGLRQLVKAERPLYFPSFSPDGRRIATSFGVEPGASSSFGVADLSASPLPVAARPVEMPMLKGELFWPTTWSRDGARLAGPVVTDQGVVSGIATYDLASGHLERTPGEDSSWKVLRWLSDGRRLLVRDRRGIAILDMTAKRWRRLLDVGGYHIAFSVDVSPDDRWITYTQTGTEGEIWLAELQGEGRGKATTPDAPSR